MKERRPKLTAAETASRPLRERFGDDLGGRAVGVPTSFAVRRAEGQRLPPWWGDGAAELDASLFSSGQEQSAKERAGASVVGADEGADKAESGGRGAQPRGDALPALPRQGAPQPPDLKAVKISRVMRTDDQRIVLAAAAVAAEAEANGANGGKGAAEGSSPVSRRRRAASPSPRSSRGQPSRTVGSRPTSTSDEPRLGLGGAPMASESKAARTCQARDAEAATSRKDVARQSFDRAVNTAVGWQHDELLRVLDNCDKSAPPPLLSAAEAAAERRSKADRKAFILPMKAEQSVP
jgi:hypothetical protein